MRQMCSCLPCIAICDLSVPAALVLRIGKLCPVLGAQKCGSFFIYILQGSRFTRVFETFPELVACDPITKILHSRRWYGRTEHTSRGPAKQFQWGRVDFFVYAVKELGFEIAWSSLHDSPDIDIINSRSKRFISMTQSQSNNKQSLFPILTKLMLPSAAWN